MAKRVVIEREAQALAAVETASVTRATSISSASGIGEALPSRTAVTNAPTQAVCPLSCLPNFMAFETGPPEARRGPEMSKCNSPAPQKTFQAALGKGPAPF